MAISRRRRADAHQYEHHGVERLQQPREHNNSLERSLAKLSSGYRINKAADDASGLVISENLKSQVSGLQQATRNAQDGISVVQTAEGALSSVQSMLQRIRDLVIQSANTGASDSTARQAAQNEIVQLRNEIDRDREHDVVRQRSTCSTAASARRPPAITSTTTSLARPVSRSATRPPRRSPWCSTPVRPRASR